MTSYPAPQPDAVEGPEQLVVRGVRLADQEVVADRRVEDAVVLPAQDDVTPVRRLVQDRLVRPGEARQCRTGGEESHQNGGQCALPGPARTDQSHALPGPELEGEVPERRSRCARPASVEHAGPTASRAARFRCPRQLMVPGHSQRVQPAGGPPAADEMTRGPRQRRHELEGGQGSEDEDRQYDAGQPPVPYSRDADQELAGHGEREGCVDDGGAGSGGGGGTAQDAGQPAVLVPEPVEAGGVAP